MTKVTNSADIALRENKSDAIINPGETRLPFAIAGDNGTGLSKEHLEKIAQADSLDFDMKGDYWSPEKPGERKRLVFQHLVKGELVANKFGANPDELIPVDTAYFVELYQENNTFKQRMLRTCATVICSFLERNSVPKHAVLDIEYKGKKKGERYFFDDFKFIPVPVNFND